MQGGPLSSVLFVNFGKLSTNFSKLTGWVNVSSFEGLTVTNNKPCSVWENGSGLDLSRSHAWIIDSHSLRRCAENAESNFSFSEVCFSFMRRAFNRLRSRKSPKNNQRWLWKQIGNETLPMLKIFFQFHPPQASSRERCRAPGPISLVDKAAGFMFDQPCSTVSPCVRPTPLA